MTHPPCVFCDLLAAGQATWVAREPEAAAFFPLPDSALAPGHTLVVPRRHVVGVLDADPQTLAATVRLVQRVGQAMTHALEATGVVVLNASGPHSGQSVPHLHFHVVPRWPDDQAHLWPADRSRHHVNGDAHHLLAAALRHDQPR
ncbi:histidine triad (HIT) family protein [Amycolatopsis tolypomycina]|uniref:Histidine triad (HIT) family protein n=1 Tax=Amycolatopsis tolypomycina TaxID=208445 RepID=A0A1H4JKP0_9PSEU|nr:HIT domain-containing protein [Amycolatopsis tolypomycina]SEB46525.1 histidine triad (HIT) family protein [Amycolatopsis tolypomycina]